MPQKSVLDGLPSFEWNSEESVAYEVAIEAICFAVAALTAAINEAQRRGDEQQVRDLEETQDRCIIERNQLNSSDPAEIAEVTRRYRALAERLQGRTQ